MGAKEWWKSQTGNTDFNMESQQYHPYSHFRCYRRNWKNNKRIFTGVGETGKGVRYSALIWYCLRKESQKSMLGTSRISTKMFNISYNQFRGNKRGGGYTINRRWALFICCHFGCHLWKKITLCTLNNALWAILFADDLVICDWEEIEEKDDVNIQRMQVLGKSEDLAPTTEGQY